MLPYSKDKFSVPQNLYIIGTMNTTDRSVGNIDYAVRRRFSFITLKSRSDIVESKSIPIASELFDAVRNYIQQNRIEMDIEDLMVGHSYFIAKDEKQLERKWKYDILPLLSEYYKDGIISEPIEDKEISFKDFIEKYKSEESE
jgi:5-methylcytosine-specific restriction endonuclease McrBC GTP-binding regulatory subunit McrB